MNMQTNLYNKTLALAGIFQAAALVKQVAQLGQCPEQSMETSVRSICITEPKSVLEVYETTSHLKLGLETLIAVLSSAKQSDHIDIARYVIGLLHLERKLTRDKQLMAILTQRLVKAKHQLSFFEPLHPNVLANFADIYLNTLSTFKLRIQVVGDPNLLGQSATLDKVRTLLLAGIRSAVLWQQLGGSRWKLVLKRKQYLQMARAILSDS